jgi:hypothetical protein
MEVLPNTPDARRFMAYYFRIFDIAGVYLNSIGKWLGLRRSTPFNLRFFVSQNIDIEEPREEKVRYC